VKKRLVVIAVVVVVAGVGGLMALSSLFHAMSTRNLNRSLANVRSAGTVLRRYCHDHGSYPATFDFQVFRQSVVPKYYRDIGFSMSYYSDGTNYAFVVRRMSFAGASARLSLTRLRLRPPSMWEVRVGPRGAMAG